MRKPIIAGNWKMNKTISEAKDLVEELIPLITTTDVEAVVCPNYLALSQVKNLTEDTNIYVGAQNMHYEESGAFTGETSAEMLKDLGIKYVVIGHSERRQYYNETDEAVNKKAKKALKSEITPIVCVGETLDEREEGVAQKVVTTQVEKALEGIKTEDLSKIVVAYEPIWAIGTGKTATSQQANEVCGWIREKIESLSNKEISEKVRIQYGGSVKPANIKELMAETHIDGALVGGASLKADQFAALVNYQK